MTSQKRYLEFTGTAPSPVPHATPDRPVAMPLSLFSVHQREKTINLAKQRQLGTPTPLSASMSAIGSETRRMLRELERRNSPVNMSSPSSSSSTKPPVSSLVTPYRAHVLPRLATLNKALYDRPVKQFVDVGVSVDLTSNQDVPKTLSTYKCASKMKGVGGSRNKFAAFDLDQDEPEVLYDNEKLNRLPRLPLNDVPSLGFISSVVPLAADSRRSSTPGSPTPDTFTFSEPIVLASPPHSVRSHKTDGFGDTGLASIKSVTAPCVDGFAKNTTVVSSASALQFAEESDRKNATVPAPLKSASVNGPSFSPSQKSPFLVNGGSAIGRSEDNLKLFSEKSVLPLKPVPDATKWTCTTCYIENDIGVQKRLACQMEKTVSKPQKNAADINATDDRWSCSVCFIKNAPDHTHCLACGTARSGQSKVLNELKSHNSELKQDKKASWSCTTCFVSNPAEKLKCLACQAAKPGSDFKPISFGFKPTFPTSQLQSSSVGVQCATSTESPTLVPTSTSASMLMSTSAPTLSPTISFGFTAAKTESIPAKDTESVASAANPPPTTTSSPLFSFGQTNTSVTSTAPLFQISSTFTPTVTTSATAVTTTSKSTIEPSLSGFLSTTSTTPSLFQFGGAVTSSVAPSTTEVTTASKSTILPPLPIFGQSTNQSAPLQFGVSTSSTSSSQSTAPTFSSFSFGSVTNAFGLSSSTPATSLATPTTSAFTFGVQTGASTSQPAPFQFGTPTSASTFQPLAPTLGNFSFGSGTNLFGISSTTSNTATPSTNFCFGAGSTSTTQTIPTTTVSQPIFGIPSTAPTAVFAPTVSSSMGLPAFGLPATVQSTNMFSITKSSSSGIAGRRTLTAKRKGK